MTKPQRDSLLAKVDKAADKEAIEVMYEKSHFRGNTQLGSRRVAAMFVDERVDPQIAQIFTD